MQYVGGTLDKGYSLDFYFLSAVNKVHKICVCMELRQMDRAVDPSKQDKSNLGPTHLALVLHLESPVLFSVPKAFELLIF